MKKCTKRPWKGREKQKVNTEGDFGRGYDCGYEYIRKDAIIERIKERLKLYGPDDPDEETVCYELQSIISWIDGKEVKK